eukprot:3735508-Prorocentrum_lima.AAC.1
MEAPPCRAPVGSAPVANKHRPRQRADLRQHCRHLHAGHQAGTLPSHFCRAWMHHAHHAMSTAHAHA